MKPYLEPHHELIVPTLTGHCGGPELPGELSDPLAALADGLERILDERGYDKVHVAGNSLGGFLAFEMADRGRAIDVVAISPGMGWEDDPPAHTQRQFRLAHRLGPWAAKRAEFLSRRPGLRKLAFRDLIAHPERVPPRAAYDLIVGSADCSIFEALMDQLEQGDYRGKWKEDLGVPTRIAWGTRDRTIPYKTCSSWYRQALPDAEWVELPDCGHLAQHDDPELVAKTILEVTARRTAVTVDRATP